MRAIAPGLAVRLILLSVCGGLLLLGAATCAPKEYTCARSQECIGELGAQGACIAGHCAFMDSTCVLWPWRYDEASGPVAGECIGPPSLDAGSPARDGAPGDATPSDGPIGDAAEADGAQADGAPAAAADAASPDGG